MNREPPAEMPPQARRSVADLIKKLASDASVLLRQEIGLAKAEMKQNVRSFVKHLSEMAVGGGVAVVGLLVLIAFAIIGLGGLLGDEYWLSSLIVAVLLLGTGGLMILSGVKRLGKTSVMPTGTVGSLKVTSGWAKEEVREFRSAVSSGREGPYGSVALPSPSGRPAMPAVPLESRPGHEVHGAETDVPDRMGSPAPYNKAGKDRLPVSKPLYKRVAHEFTEDDVLGQAAKVAYFMFTSLPPALLVLFSLAGLFGGERLGSFLSAELQQVLPGSANDPDSAAGFISQFIDQVVQSNAPGPLSIGLLVGIWAGSAVFVALMDSLNKAYDVEDDRSWFKKRAITIGVMIGFILLFVGGSLVLLIGPQVAGALQLGGVAELAWTILQWPLAFLLVIAAFFLAYYVLPNRDQSRCKKALFKGSAIAAALWLVATFGFRIYISNFGSYSETYGFVGAILVLLLWMYLTGIVILLGGEIASEMEREARA